jgi:hypothetical protein
VTCLGIIFFDCSEKIKGKYSEKEEGKQNLTPKASKRERGIPKNNKKGRGHITNWMGWAKNKIGI